MVDADNAQVTTLLNQASQAVNDEQTRVRDEHDAFHAFIERIQSLDPTPQQRSSTVPLQTHAPTTDSSLRAVRDAYEATIMSVPHYESEYNDTYTHSLTEELGPDIATALTQQTHFDQTSKQAVLTAAQTAKTKRSRLLEALEAEADSITTGMETLLPVARQVHTYREKSFDACSMDVLDGYHNRLNVLESQCLDVVESRQGTRRIQHNRMRLPYDGPDLTYVYTTLPVDYPLIATAAALVEALQTLKKQVQQAQTSASFACASQASDACD